MQKSSYRDFHSALNAALLCLRIASDVNMVRTEREGVWHLNPPSYQECADDNYTTIKIFKTACCFIEWAVFTQTLT